ncbi:MAG: hypothetical protein ACKORI_06835, partial [Verrucomicrobiota bacterium]
MTRPDPRRKESVRIAARAVIIRDGMLLTVRVRTDEGEFLVLPGGGQEHGEIRDEGQLGGLGLESLFLEGLGD